MAKIRKIGPFILERKIGLGGMGVVYLATYEKNNRKVAVKVLSPSMSSNPKLLQRFEREMAILKKLQDPHIVQYFGGGKYKGQHFYAMELVTGGTLDEVIKERSPLDWEYVVDCGVQICRGLENAHALGIIHRDLKPANLFVSKKSGEIKLGDFGIARDTTATALTEAGRTVGTYAYMAPEQILGKPPVSRKTDLYALGCVLFEMLTGKTPFEADTPATMLMMHLDDDPPRVRAFNMECPVWLETLIMKLLEKDPRDRPFDAAATRGALEEVREKVATQMSVATQVATGGSTAIDIQTGTPELKKILKKKKKKKKKQVPLHEKTWFLSLCLALLTAVVVWGMWPLSAEQHYERAMAYLQNDQEYEARERHLLVLIEDYPESKYAKLAQEKLDELEMNRALADVERDARKTELPFNKNVAKAKFITAWKSENEIGDKQTALNLYKSLVEVLEVDKKNQSKEWESYRVYYLLAQRKIEEIQSQPISENQQLVLILKNMQEADQLYRQAAFETRNEATRKWNSLLELYGKNQEFFEQMEYCRKRLAAEEVEPWDYSLLEQLQEDAAEEDIPENTSGPES